MKTLQDLLLRNPDYIFKYEDKFFSTIVAANSIVIYLAKTDIAVDNFVRLADDLKIESRVESKAGFIPIIHVDDITVDTTLFEEVFK